MTKRFFSKHSINVFNLELEKWDYPLHNHNFYELIFIQKGMGYQILNNVRIPYNAGDIFLLTPSDEHIFEISKKTIFTFLKFTEQLLSEKTENSPNSRWLKKIKAIIIQPNVQPSSIINNSSDSNDLFNLLAILKNEYLLNDAYSNSVVLELFGALMMKICRLMNKNHNHLSVRKTSNEEKIEQVLSYIRQHVLIKEKVNIQSIADKFMMSHNYVSTFIKKHTGISIQQIVLNTKIRTAEQLLLQSGLTISEISIKLGFNDSSHFSKTFKKHKSVSPKDFRKKHHSLLLEEHPIQVE